MPGSPSSDGFARAADATFYLVLNVAVEYRAERSAFEHERSAVFLGVLVKQAAQPRRPLEGRCGDARMYIQA